MEITNRLQPLDAAALGRIGRRDSAEADDAFRLLRGGGLPAGAVIAAYWVKPQFSTHMGCEIRSAHVLSYVAQGVLDGNCRNLQFFMVAEGRVAGPYEISREDMFL